MWWEWGQTDLLFQRSAGKGQKWPKFIFENTGKVISNHVVGRILFRYRNGTNLFLCYQFVSWWWQIDSSYWKCRSTIGTKVYDKNRGWNCMSQSADNQNNSNGILIGELLPRHSWPITWQKVSFREMIGRPWTDGTNCLECDRDKDGLIDINQKFEEKCDFFAVLFACVRKVL